MDPSCGAKQQNSTPIESEKSSEQKLSNTTDCEKSLEISTQDSSISHHLPKELLSAIIDYIPKTQWPSLELVNRSFRDAVYSCWQSMKEFDMHKDLLGIRQSVKQAARIHLVDFIPSILAKLHLRSPMLESIIGFPSIYTRVKDISPYKSDILHILCQFTNLKRIDFGTCLTNVELVAFLTSSSSRHRLVEINSSADHLRNSQLPAIFNVQETSEPQESRLKLEKLSLKSEYQNIFLEPRIIDLIDLSSLTVLVMEKIATPSDYLLSLIRNCNQVQQLQFSFMEKCRCKNRPCVHLTSSKRILEAIAAMESLDSLRIGLINNGDSFHNQAYLDIKDDMPVLINRLGQRGRLVEFGLLHENFCSLEVIRGIGQHLAGLKSLELATKECLSRILVSMIKKMAVLEKLTFNCEGRYIWVAFKPMATHLKNLKSFHVRFPSRSQMKIDCLQVLTGLKRLEELSIANAFCNNVEWESAFGQLKSLEMRDCREELVITLLKQAPGLRRLVISGSNISDNVLCMIPTTCPGLLEISVSSSKAYTKEAVQAIVDGCPKLEQLRC